MYNVNGLTSSAMVQMSFNLAYFIVLIVMYFSNAVTGERDISYIIKPRNMLDCIVRSYYSDMTYHC